MRGIFKRIFAVLMVISLFAGLTSPAFALQSAGFSYEVISGSTDVRITGYNGSSQEVVIPDILDGRTVVEISENAFSGNANVKSVVISSNVQRIMKNAFKGCVALQSVSIPASVSSIGDSAFANCVALNTIAISSASTTIGYYAFEGCTSLRSVVIPSSRIRDAAFRNCAMLESITLLDSVQSVGRNAFDGTAWYDMQRSGLITLGNVVYSYTGDDETVVLPGNIRCIADYAFADTAVKNVVIPNGVYYIGIGAFYNCTAMESVSVPSSVIRIELRAFGYNADGVVSGFIVYAYNPSTAYSWAINNNMHAEDITDCTHSYADWVVTSAATCTSSGSRMRRCIKCNAEQSEVLEAFGHSWSGDIVISQLSCTVDGITRRTCTLCGETDDSVVLAPGHTWGDWSVITEPTCAQSGEQEHTCAVCGTTQRESIAPLGHTWTVSDDTDSEGWYSMTEPTCDEPGKKSRVCSVCGYVDTADIEPLGHTAKEWTVIKDATPITTGIREGVCTVCGETFTDEIPMLSQEMPDSVKALNLISDSTLSFNASKTCLLGVKPGMTVTDVLLQFDYPGHIIISDMQLAKLDNDDTVGTGCFIFLMKVNAETQQLEAIDTTCIVIQGDVDGNGVVTAADARLALRAASKLEKLNSPCFMAADVNSDNAVQASDARKILRVSSKLESF